uniref:ZP domain-containing protein n=1 Tax=Strigamia maritima TaxID=126957 RepID=T1IWN1_STRMM
MLPRKTILWTLMSFLISVAADPNHLFSDQSSISDVQVACNSDSIQITLLASSEFNGLIYPRGLPRNSTCMTEYTDATGELKYRMPLHSCNTMSTDVTDGIEYYNTVVVQPHRRLVTNQGRGYHIRCRYQTKDKTSLSNPIVNISDLPSLLSDGLSQEVPTSVMKIYIGDDNLQLHQAENVKIGDELRMVITIDPQTMYGMKVSNCLVRDGLNWGDQQLINNYGCSVDRELMGELEYSADKTMATVRFQAHKFPYTSSVYYQCNVQLCLKQSPDCDDVPPLCTSDGRNLRRKRSAQNDEDIDKSGKQQEQKDLNVAVYSGLHVNDPQDESIEDIETAAATSEDDNAFCISAKLFAIIIAIIGIFLMLAVILLVVCLIQRRRRRKDLSTTAGSSIYSGPYINHAYSNS